MQQLQITARDIDITRVIAGDKAAWDRFVEIFSGLIYGVAARTLRARSARAADDAADVAQDVFVRLIKDDCRLLRAYDPDRATLPTWLTVVTRSAALDHLRRPDSRQDTVELGETLPAREEAAFGGRLDLPPDILSERQAQVLRMLFDEDMDVAEIAGALNVQAQTVRSIKHQALERLREHYGACPAC